MNTLWLTRLDRPDADCAGSFERPTVSDDRMIIVI
jgi:hypothetical protein